MSDDLEFACPVCKKEPSRGVFVGAKIYHDECLIKDLVDKFKSGGSSQEDIEKILKKVKNSKITKGVEEATWKKPEPVLTQEEIDAAFAASMEEAEGEAANMELKQAAAEEAEANSYGSTASGGAGGIPKGSGGGKTQAAQPISVAQMPSYVGAPVVSGGGGIPKIEVSYLGFRFKVQGTEEFVEKNYKEFGEKYIDMLICDKLGILEPENATTIDQETDGESEPTINEGEQATEIEKLRVKTKKSPSKKSSAKKDTTIPPVKPVQTVRPKKVKKKKK